jgi:copper chaperone
MQTITFQISGMVCGGCAGTVTRALKALPGVAAVEVSHSEAKAEISFDPALVQLEQLKSTVERAGYKVVA